MYFDEFNVFYSYKEVLVNGRKQGVTKKTINNPRAVSALCKKSFLDTFKRLWEHSNGTATFTYLQLKSKATLYQQQWGAIKNQLGCWTEKPKGLMNFT